jgi:hypothetical protein
LLKTEEREYSKRPCAKQEDDPSYGESSQHDVLPEASTHIPDLNRNRLSTAWPAAMIAASRTSLSSTSPVISSASSMMPSMAGQFTERGDCPMSLKTAPAAEQPFCLTKMSLQALLETFIAGVVDHFW